VEGGEKAVGKEEGMKGEKGRPWRIVVDCFRGLQKGPWYDMPKHTRLLENEKTKRNYKGEREGQ